MSAQLTLSLVGNAVLGSARDDTQQRYYDGPLPRAPQFQTDSFDLASSFLDVLQIQYRPFPPLDFFPSHPTPPTDVTPLPISPSDEVVPQAGNVLGTNTPKDAFRLLYTPRDAYEWTAGHPMSDISILSTRVDNPVFSISIREGTIGDQRLKHLAVVWNKARNAQWKEYGMFREIFVYKTYLRDLQGTSIPRVVAVYSGIAPTDTRVQYRAAHHHKQRWHNRAPVYNPPANHAVTLVLELPHPVMWVEATADMPHVLKCRCIRALARVHARGVVHGALSLRRFLIGADARVCITDFRHARIIVDELPGDIEDADEELDDETTPPVHRYTAAKAALEKSHRAVGLRRATAADARMEMRLLKFKLDYIGPEEYMSRMTKVHGAFPSKHAGSYGDDIKDPFAPDIGAQEYERNKRRRCRYRDLRVSRGYQGPGRWRKDGEYAFDEDFDESADPWAEDDFLNPPVTDSEWEALWLHDGDSKPRFSSLNMDARHNVKWGPTPQRHVVPVGSTPITEDVAPAPESAFIAHDPEVALAAREADKFERLIRRTMHIHVDTVHEHIQRFLDIIDELTENGKPTVRGQRLIEDSIKSCPPMQWTIPDNAVPIPGASFLGKGKGKAQDAPDPFSTTEAGGNILRGLGIDRASKTDGSGDTDGASSFMFGSSVASVASSSSEAGSSSMARLSPSAAGPSSSMTDPSSTASGPSSSKRKADNTNGEEGSSHGETTANGPAHADDVRPNKRVRLSPVGLDGEVEELPQRRRESPPPPGRHGGRPGLNGNRPRRPAQNEGPLLRLARTVSNTALAWGRLFMNP
ncbi:hypothetical protein FISHEDRAFT_71517 [Fistulina hepatica ATCC 64428]|uniref:Protein kinase domain-containing protein n=1 Tax=Fistulina hepatica ATCC 64428 TaxID=1128425 RepID=A0A0D7AGP5_9AGAR|nr:hypothetical protein FISHEDRAFT_71517 [Fistulina hepatica ATCC 64428]